MDKNAVKIKEGIYALAHNLPEIISGTVVAGSTDTAAGTISVMPCEGTVAIEGVMLGTVTGAATGMIVYPADGSDVVIGSIDGPGVWILLKASELTKAMIKIGNVLYEIDDNQLNIQNGSVVFNAGTSIFRISTASESLYQLLNDLITAITALTVGTSTGPSTVPVNIATFENLLTRLGNLLGA